MEDRSAPLADELTELLVGAGQVRIERIVSQGHVSPPDLRQPKPNRSGCQALASNSASWRAASCESAGAASAAACAPVMLFDRKGVSPFMGGTEPINRQ